MTTTDWDAYAGTYRQLVDESTVPPLLAGVMSASSGTMIDVGCGDGILLDLIRSTFARTWKIQRFEISPARAEIARGRGHEVLADEHGDVPAPSGTFDLVTSTHVIEHAPDDHAYATELARLVLLGGLVYVETPVKLKGAWYFRRNPEAGWVLDPTHVREYRSAAAVNAVLESAGLEVIAEDPDPGALPARGGRAARAEARPPPAAHRPAPLGLGALEVSIPRYRQQAVLARRRTDS